MAGGELSLYVRALASSWLPARKLVAKALEHRYEIHPSGQIIVLDRNCPWKEHVLDSDLPILYVLYPDSNGWRVQCVPTRPEAFENRKGLPES